MLIPRDDQRVDLEKAHVLLDEGPVELADEIAGLLGEVARQAERPRHGAAVMGLDAGGRIDREGVDLLRRVVGDLLDIHAAFGRDDEGDAARRAVDQRREIELGGDVGAFLDIEPADLLAGLAGLGRDERLAEHLADEGLDLVDRAGEAHAALVAGVLLLELALAAAAGVDLRFHHPQRSAEFLGGVLGLVGGEHRLAAGHRHPEFLQDRLTLVFVDVHRPPLVILGRCVSDDPRTSCRM